MASQWTRCIWIFCSIIGWCYRHNRRPIFSLCTCKQGTNKLLCNAIQELWVINCCSYFLICFSLPSCNPFFQTLTSLHVYTLHFTGCSSAIRMPRLGYGYLVYNSTRKNILFKKSRPRFEQSSKFMFRFLSS